MAAVRYREFQYADLSEEILWLCGRPGACGRPLRTLGAGVEHALTKHKPDPMRTDFPHADDKITVWATIAACASRT
jgi:hypothetical protein